MGFDRKSVNWVNEDQINEAKLVDQIYKQLANIKEFKNLSMDRQGEISVSVEKMIKGK